MIPRIHPKPSADLVTSEQPSPSGWLARNRAAVSVCHPERSRRGIILYLRLQREKPAESKFCFLKLPIVFGYAVSFAAISKKQNRKGSPRSLIYSLKSKLTFFMIKQFFAFGRVHQTLMRSRLRRFCSERCIAADADQKANYFYAAVCTLLSPQNFDSPFGLPQDDMLTLETLWLLVTLSKAGCTVLSSGRHSKSPAASNFREWCKPERKAKNACIF